MKSLIFVILINIFLAVFSTVGHAQGLPLEVHLVINTGGNPPTTVDEFLALFNTNSNFLFITITNHTSETQKYKLQLKATNQERGFVITTIDPLAGPCLSVGPNQMDILNLQDLEGVFSKNNLEVQNSDLSFLDFLADNTLLEGHYTICLTALDCNNGDIQMSNEDDLSCAPFEVKFTQPPYNIQLNGIPVCYQIVPAEMPQLTMSWMFDVPPGWAEPITYDIRFYEYDADDEIDPNDFDFVVPPAYTIMVEDQLVQNILIPDDLILVAGKKYAVRIQAKSPGLSISNDGYSAVCSFNCIGEGMGQYHIEDSYPNADYPVLFTKIPISFRLAVDDDEAPEFDKYNHIGRYQYNMVLSGRRIVDNLRVSKSWGRTLKWEYGPFISQRNILGECIENEDFDIERSRHIIHNNTQGMMDLGKGWQYTAYVTGTIKYPLNLKHSANVLKGNHFVTGMPSSAISSPQNQDTININTAFDISFTTAAKPAGMILVPDYNLYYKQDGPCIQFNDTLMEAWQLQVSSSPGFESRNIKFAKSEVIGNPSDPSFTFKSLFDLNGRKNKGREEILIDKLFKDVSFHLDSLPTGKYWARVYWKSKPQNAQDTTFYSVSPVVEFVVGKKSGGANSTKDNSQEDVACIPSCRDITFNSTETITRAVGDTFKMRGFPIVITSLNDANKEQLKGKGVALIHMFYLDVKINVDFSGVRVNTDTMAMAGEVKAVNDVSVNYNTYYVKGKKILGITNDIADQVYNGVVSSGRLIDGLSGNAVSLPCGLNYDIDDHKFLLAVTDLLIKPNDSKITLIGEFKMPDVTQYWLSAGMEACIMPEGITDSIKLFVPHDIGTMSPDPNETNFYLNGLENAPDENWATWIKWNCDKDMTINLSGRLEFSREKLVPELADGKLDENKTHKVNGKFVTRLDFQHDASVYSWGYICGIDITPFRIDGLDDWSFKVQNAFLDRSELANPAGIEFPPIYDFPGKGMGSLENTWKGVYIENIAVKTPEGLIGDNNRVQFNANKLIYDQTGITFDLRILDFMNVNSDMANSGWGITLDTCRMRVLQNMIQEISLTGNMTSPYFDEEDHLKYKAAYIKTIKLDKDSHEPIDTTSGYSFVITPDGDLHIPMGGATFQLDDTSYIAMIKNDINKKWEFKTKLAGLLSLDNDYIKAHAPTALVPYIKYTGIRMEHFETSNGHFDRKPSFSFASPQKAIGKFPISLVDIDMDMEGSNFVTKFTGKLDLVGDTNSLTGVCKFSIISSLTGSNKQFFKISDLRLDSIMIDATLFSVRIKGNIAWYKHDSNDGIKGYVFVGLPMDISGQLLMDFGTHYAGADSKWNTADYYSYWHIEAMISGHFPMLPPFSLYSLGGGVYYHMKYENNIYTPDFNTLGGIELKSRLATDPKKESFNMDVTIGGALNSNGGLSNIYFNGGGWIMQPFDAQDPFGTRNNPNVWAQMDMNYTTSTKTLHGEMDVYVHYDSYIIGNANNQYLCGKSELHIDPDEWYLYVGRYDRRNKLRISEGIAINLDAYLMVGQGIPATLPPIPDAVMAILSNQTLQSDQGGITASENTLSDTRSADDVDRLEQGKGFALGASIDIQVPKFTFLILYAQFRFCAGFDLLMVQPESPVYCTNTGSNKGIHNWYASGQLYAALDGSLGIQVDLWKTYSIELVHLKAGIMINGGTPSPTYFSGMTSVYYSVLGGIVEGTSSFAFTVGKKCVTGNGGALDDVKFIDQMKPETPASVFSNVTTTFYFPIEKPMTLPVTDANGNVTGQETIYPYIDLYELKDNSGNIILSKSSNRFDQAHYIAELVRSADLKPNTNYSATIRIMARKNNEYGEIFKDGNQNWKEQRTLNFKTGPMPSTIPMSEQFYSSPLPYQKYYLKGEQSNDEAFVNFVTPKNDYTYGSKTIQMSNGSTTIQYKYEARIVGGGDTLTTSFPVGKGNMFSISGVSGLKNNRVYRLQLVRKRKTVNSPIGIDLSNLEYATSESSGNNGRTRRLTYSNIAVQAVQNSVVDSIKLLSFEFSKEFVFFSLPFKTSSFNTISEKASSVQSTPFYYSGSGYNPDYYNVYTYWKEPIEEYDVRPYISHYVAFPPLCEVSSEIRTGPSSGFDSYQRDVAKPYLYNLISEIDNRSFNPIDCNHFVPPKSTNPEDLVTDEINYTCRLHLSKINDVIINPINITQFSSIDPDYFNPPPTHFPIFIGILWTTNGGVNLPASTGISTGSNPPPKHILIKYNTNKNTLSNAIDFDNKQVAIWNKKVGYCIESNKSIFSRYSPSTVTKLNNWKVYPRTYSWGYNFRCDKEYPIQFRYKKFDKANCLPNNHTNPSIYSGNYLNKSFKTAPCVIIY